MIVSLQYTEMNITTQQIVLVKEVHGEQVFC